MQNELAYAMGLRKPVFPLLLAGPSGWRWRRTSTLTAGALPPVRFYNGLAGLLTAGQRMAADTYQRERLRRRLRSRQSPSQPVRPDLLIIDKPLRLELVRVPAGEFLMGSDPAKDKGAQRRMRSRSTG